jgi:hypothetical protein
MGWLTYQDYDQQFFDPANAPEVRYIQRLSSARVLARDWMVHGRATRSLNYFHNNSDLHAGCFLRDKTKTDATLVCAVALPALGAWGGYTLKVDPSKYGLVVPNDAHVQLSDLAKGIIHGTFSHEITFSSVVPSYGVHLLHFRVIRYL